MGARTVIALFYYGSVLFRPPRLPPHKGFLSTMQEKTSDVIRAVLMTAADTDFCEGTKGRWEEVMLVSLAEISRRGPVFPT